MEIFSFAGHSDENLYSNILCEEQSWHETIGCGPHVYKTIAVFGNDTKLANNPGVSDEKRKPSQIIIHATSTVSGSILVVKLAGESWFTKTCKCCTPTVVMVFQHDERRRLGFFRTLYFVPLLPSRVQLDTYRFLLEFFRTGESPTTRKS